MGQWLKRPGRLAALIAAVLAVKLVYIFASNPFMDEAYYWLWGQHPALGYYDHPPLIGWTLGLSAKLFGWSVFALRAPLLLTLAADALILFAFARRFAPQTPWSLFLVSLLVFLTQPMFSVLTATAIPDHLMITFGLWALYAYSGFLEDWGAGRRTRFAGLYWGSLALGFAVLAKHNAGLIGLGLAVFIVLSRPHRNLLARWQLYAAAALAFVLQTPVLLWNLDNDWAGVRFLLVERQQGAPDTLFPFMWLALYVLGLWFFFSPVLVPAGIRAVRRGVDGAGSRFLLVTAGLSTLVFGLLSLRTNVMFHWNLVAFLALLPLIAPMLRGWAMLLAQTLFGLAFLLLVAVNFNFVPALHLVGRRDWSAEWSYGFAEVAAAVRDAAAETGAGSVAGTRYGPASALAFTLQRPDMLSLDPARDGFDFWPDAARALGKDVIIVTDRWGPMRPEIEARFARVEPLKQVTVRAGGRVINTYDLYLGRGLRPGEQ